MDPKHNGTMMTTQPLAGFIVPCNAQGLSVCLSMCLSVSLCLLDIDTDINLVSLSLSLDGRRQTAETRKSGAHSASGTWKLKGCPSTGTAVFVLPGSFGGVQHHKRMY